jgi:hypothetical protein
MAGVSGGRHKHVVDSREDVYEALRRHGMSAEKAARIANAGRTHAARSLMARKAARTRKRRGES